jgi:predicted enzyme related to lactoylglutathione lyase
MLTYTKPFSGFSVNDLEAAKQFYSEKLALSVEQTPMGLKLHIAEDTFVFVYAKPDHEPASFTILNFEVDDIEQAVEELTSADIQLEHYQDLTDETGIARGIESGRGPDIAWFKDPAGNILSVLQSS